MQRYAPRPRQTKKSCRDPPATARKIIATLKQDPFAQRLTIASGDFDGALPAELVDLTLLVNTINAWNRFAIAFRKLPA